MKLYAIKNYQRDSKGENELVDVSITAIFTRREDAATYLRLTPDVELEIQEVQVSGSIDLGGLEIIRD